VLIRPPRFIHAKCFADRLSLSSATSKDVAASGLPEYALDNLCNVDGFPVARVQSDTSDLFPGMAMLNSQCFSSA
jgi:hypothetical protein